MLVRSQPAGHPKVRQEPKRKTGNEDDDRSGKLEPMPGNDGADGGQ